ncbi:MAG: ferritin family protein [Deltaproteobacteria bacterium]|nr:ferritin family protein [Deltaproteobacteria bacterium]
MSEACEMKNKDSESIIERAIQNEQEAYDFYMDLSCKIADREAKDTLVFLAQEEKKHKAYLLQYRQAGFTGPSRPVIDYKVAENLVKPDVKKDMDSKDVYLIAANRELNAHNFYKGLAELHPAGDVREMLLRMADEELKHKEKFEYLYANTAFTQTAGG